jgi:hypothetical protein
MFTLQRQQGWRDMRRTGGYLPSKGSGNHRAWGPARPRRTVPSVRSRRRCEPEAMMDPAEGIAQPTKPPSPLASAAYLSSLLVCQFRVTPLCHLLLSHGLPYLLCSHRHCGVWENCHQGGVFTARIPCPKVVKIRDFPRVQGQMVWVLPSNLAGSLSILPQERGQER